MNEKNLNYSKCGSKSSVSLLKKLCMILCFHLLTKHEPFNNVPPSIFSLLKKIDNVPHQFFFTVSNIVPPIKNVSRSTLGCNTYDPKERIVETWAGGQALRGLWEASSCVVGDRLFTVDPGRSLGHLIIVFDLKKQVWRPVKLKGVHGCLFVSISMVTSLEWLILVGSVETTVAKLFDLKLESNTQTLTHSLMA